MAGDVGTDTGDTEVGGGTCGSGGVKFNRLELGWGQRQGGRTAVIEACVGTVSKIKRQLHNNKQQCLRL